MVRIGKTTSGPAKVGYLHFLQGIDHVVANTLRVWNGLVVISNIKSTIDAATQVFGEMTVNVFADLILASVGIEGDRSLSKGGRRRNNEGENERGLTHNDKCTKYIYTRQPNFS